MKYSIVIPVNNEEDNLPILIEELHSVAVRLKAGTEVIFIDDESTDLSFNILRHYKKKYKWMKIIQFEKRCGQSAGFDAGIREAKGELIITMDADLQNDPADILKLLKYYPRYDVITGKRKNRKDSMVKLISSRIANYIRNRITHENIVDTGCSLKVFKKEYIKRIKMFNGLHRFLPTLCKMEGAKVIEVYVSHRSRRYGKTHYGVLNRAFVALADAFAVRWMQKRYLSYRIKKVIK
ncbi:MAG: glycosyltransferase family 2 protein [Spirochaetes bacterium]|nr:glycosyltransferase family 2 protein [Spirochaetota bacterium]